MSKFARHEIVMNGVNTEGKLQRTLVLDADNNPRHVFKLNRHFAERFERTSQFAFPSDIILETNANYTEEAGITDIDFRVYRLSGPFSSAGGRPQLFRVEIKEYTDMFRKLLTQGELKNFLAFMLLDENFEPLKVDPMTVNAVLPKFLGWDGEVGITEEKQSAYVLDLLGGAPVEYIEEIATYAMYSKRQYIMPYEEYGLPAVLDFHNAIPTTPGFTPRDDMEINWVVYFNDGAVSVVRNEEDAREVDMQHVSTALKLYLEPFTTETGDHFGLVVEIYSSKKSASSTVMEDDEALSA